eukprot:50789-Eustigmatos_ZCMA.PRE.1
MEKRKPFDMGGPLAYWNLFLSLFSWAGAIRTVPYLFYYMAHMSFKDINCVDPFVTQADRDVGFWMVLFSSSKLIELVDTLFIVLRKKPL